MEEDIQRNFEFLYFGRGRHLCSDPLILNLPLETLKGLGGVESLAVQSDGIDNVNKCYSRGFSFVIKVFKFPGHSIEAYCTREERPEHPENPNYITRIRLGNYDFTDDFPRKISEELLKIPKSD